ncbi:MAG: NAD(+) synthase [Flavobacteriia bacterium]|nr:NAD(+) synthase [Flavobacteriia bacterium]
MNESAVTSHIVEWMKSYALQARAKGFVVGVSGGIDSAVTSALAAQTGLAVHLLEMPIYQPESHVTRAWEHMDYLAEKHDNVFKRRVDLSPVYEAHVKALDLDDSDRQFLALANTRARLRMATLYAEAQNHGLLVAGTGNKVEDFGVGFYTKYGDGGVDLSPIADLMKSEVYALGAYLGVSKAILKAAPTDGLWSDDRNDEDQLGATYPELEWAMEFAESMGWDAASPQEADGRFLAGRGLTVRQGEIFQIYARFHRANRHKMLPIPVCVVPKELK